MITKAQEFATLHHAGQMYDDKPYTFHLQQVYDNLVKFGFLRPMHLAAAWLHDIVEDTSVTLHDVEREFGYEVADIVWAVTAEGKTRAEKTETTKRKLIMTPKAVAVKAADRLANMSYSFDHSLGRFKKYKEEFPTYDPIFTMYTPKMADAMRYLVYADRVRD